MPGSTVASQAAENEKAADERLSVVKIGHEKVFENNNLCNK